MKNLGPNVIALLAALMGFAIGYGVKWLLGYHYRLHSQVQHGSGDSIATEKHFSESVGLEIALDTGSSSIEWREAEGAWPITIYKAKRAFQEDSPVVRDVRVDGNIVTWSDGMNKYSLKIDAMEKQREWKSEPAPPANPRQSSGR